MATKKSISITAYSRLHLTLIGMNNQGYRINGGIGFSIAEPNINIQIGKSKSFNIIDKRKLALNEGQLSRLKCRIDKIIFDLNLEYNIEVEISGFLPSNSGFGSGTIVRLACIEGLLCINNFEFDDELIVNLSGRGGTSGIGVRTYFKGGWVADLGKKNIGQGINPSNRLEYDNNQSLLLAEGKMPNWNIGICVPHLKNPLSKIEEAKFFADAKLSNEAVFETLYHSIFGVLGSIKENDESTFAVAISAIQKCQWKNSERKIYGGAISYYEEILYKHGAQTVGMSSFGPALFFISDNIANTIESVKSIIEDSTFYNTTTLNEGRILKVNA